MSNAITNSTSDPLTPEQAETTFQRAFELVLALEGGYVNDPDDRGGATNYGVTQVTYNAFRDTIGKPEQSVKHITEWEARQIYRKMYWETGKCGELPKLMAIAHFDACVNHGPKQAVRFLQHMSGATEDGLFGPKTQEAVRATVTGGTEHVSAYLWERMGFYIDLCRKDPSQGKFLKGWYNRLVHIGAGLGIIPVKNL